MSRARLRNLGIKPGKMPTGTYNAITDVPGVLVGQETIIQDDQDSQRVARTGVTMIVPRDGDIWNDHACAGFFSFNGCGEMTGLPWIEESGMIHTPIGITNTNSVGVVRDALAAYPMVMADKWNSPPSISSSWAGSLPVVAETWDGWLNDITAFHVTQEHAFKALQAARSGLVPEGNVGGGTGMICHEFKGGTGTSSRIVPYQDRDYTVGVLVQSNYGNRDMLRIDGVPVGRELDFTHVANPWLTSPKGGSIIVIIATDVPLLPTQCTRLAKRATVGLARVGGTGQNGSGDIFLAFSTGNHALSTSQGFLSMDMLPNDHLNDFFDAVAEATEEAILNALCAAETMIGWQGHRVEALPLEDVQRIMERYRPR
ncbi:DmpA family aminopeptidase [Dictyobacter arantiisoli]|uniref:D-aminopeptidase n=1 Tax=Dictyobacter arantiisoli TaxID=2014874 RepID=A0A5A5TJ02_9CHLR|nr:P1 family peptidase [Dictyobacter arantiisoli]GCF10973.1 D-aminopeptidase [Dictyobacter arantiisoli]